MSQSKVRRDHEPWHDVAIPLNPEPEVKEDDAPKDSQFSEHKIHHCSCCYEHEISYHTYTEKKSDFVEITASTSGLTSCTARSGMLAGVPILGEQFNMKKVQQSISQAWKLLSTMILSTLSSILLFQNSGMTSQQKPFGSSVLMWQDGKTAEDAL